MKAEPDSNNPKRYLKRIENSTLATLTECLLLLVRLRRLMKPSMFLVCVASRCYLGDVSWGFACAMLSNRLSAKSPSYKFYTSSRRALAASVQSPFHYSLAGQS